MAPVRSLPTASNSTPWLGSPQSFELLRYAVMDVAGSVDGSVVTAPGCPSDCTSSHAVMVNRPVRSARTLKSKVCTWLLGVGDPIPSWPLPITLASGTPHVTEKLVMGVPSAGTVTVRGFAPLTVQFEGTPDSATGWSPAGPVNVTLPFVAIGWLEVPSIVTV